MAAETGAAMACAGGSGSCAVGAGFIARGRALVVMGAGVGDSLTSKSAAASWGLVFILVLVVSVSRFRSKFSLFRYRVWAAVLCGHCDFAISRKRHFARADIEHETGQTLGVFRFDCQLACVSHKSNAIGLPLAVISCGIALRPSSPRVRPEF